MNIAFDIPVELNNAILELNNYSPSTRHFYAAEIEVLPLLFSSTVTQPIFSHLNRFDLSQEDWGRYLSMISKSYIEAKRDPELDGWYYQRSHNARMDIALTASELLELSEAYVHLDDYRNSDLLTAITNEEFLDHLQNLIALTTCEISTPEREMEKLINKGKENWTSSDKRRFKKFEAIADDDLSRVHVTAPQELRVDHAARANTVPKRFLRKYFSRLYCIGLESDFSNGLYPERSPEEIVKGRPREQSGVSVIPWLNKDHIRLLVSSLFFEGRDVFDIGDDQINETEREFFDIYKKTTSNTDR